MKTLYVATSNDGKLRDFAVAASAHDLTILSLPGLAEIPAPPEDAPDFAGNARVKAEYYSRFLPGEAVLSDDSGLGVDALGGAPGVRSARYAADAGFSRPGTIDANNNLYLLQQLGDEPNRDARYLCALSVARNGAEIVAAEGTVAGVLLKEPRGQGGFGYDPFFFLPAMGKTMAEVDSQQRWQVSHRGQAFRVLLEKLDGF